MGRPRNLVVAQSGGPSPVINNSLRAIVELARDLDSIGTVYGARHGIEGVLKEELIDLSAQLPEEIALLRVTPAAGSIGTCRYKLKANQQEDFERVIEVFKAHQVGYFLYIGGNDSMDTAHKVAQLAQERGLDLVAVGVPKTIDNDVGDSEFKLIDHTPGYGSVAKYWMHMIQNANEENAGSSPADPVLVLQAMGRKIGYIPAAARLADPDRHLPLSIFLAERPCSLEQLADHVNERLRVHGRAIVVVSEGLNVGEIGELRDSFGHVQFSSSQTTVAQVIVNHLNRVGLAAKGAARGTWSGPISGIRWLTPRRSIWTKPTSAAKRPPCWPPMAKAATWPPCCASRGRSTTCATTACRWKKWQGPTARFPPAGSAPRGPT